MRKKIINFNFALVYHWTYHIIKYDGYFKLINSLYFQFIHCLSKLTLKKYLETFFLLKLRHFFQRDISPPLLSRSIPGYLPKIFYLSSCFCTIYCLVCSSLPSVRVLKATGTDWEASYNLLTGDQNTMTNLSCNIENLPSWWVQTFIGKIRVPTA